MIHFESKRLSCPVRKNGGERPMKNLNFPVLPSAELTKASFIENRLIQGCLTFILIMIFFSVNAFAYTPHLGIPNPSMYFGTFGEIDQPTPNPATKCPSWPSAPTVGCYYIDKTNTACTNTNNTYGYPNKPRCLPPEGLLAAGSYVYIHAGTYNPIDTDGDRFDWHGAGTASNPIWITGNASSRPILTDFVHIGAAGSVSYMVVENLALTSGANMLISPSIDGTNIDHVIIRNCVLTGRGLFYDGSGIGIGPSSGDDGIPNSTIKYVVVYNNTVSAFGDKSKSDQGGVYQGYHTNATWVLNNTIFDIAADGVAGSHYSDYTSKLANNFYIGGNTIYGNGEDGIDIKVTDGIVISGNTITGPCYAGRGAGSGIVLHYGANNLPCKNALVQYNTIYNISTGIGNGGSYGCDNCSYVGNRFSNITNAYACAYEPTFSGWGIQIGGSHGTIRVTDNICYNCEKGLVGIYRQITSPDVLVNERNTISAVPLNTSSSPTATTNTSSTSTTATGTTTTTTPTTNPTTGTTVAGTTTPTTTSPITTSSTTPRWNKKIKLFRR